MTASKELTRSEVHAIARASRIAAEDLIHRIEQSKLGVAQAFHEMGRCLADLLEKKLYAALGYSSFEGLLEARELMSSVQASKLIEVSKQFSKRDAARLGLEKAYALSRHVARTKQKDDPSQYLNDGFPVGGRRRPIDDVTVREILDATRTAVSRQQGQHSASERARRDADSIQRKVHAAIAKRIDGQFEVRAYFRRGAWRLSVDLPAESANAALV